MPLSSTYLQSADHVEAGYQHRPPQPNNAGLPAQLGDEMTKKKIAAPEPVETIVSFKGFDKNLKCRDFQFAIGESFVHGGDV
ncbi:MAG: hypothetical protein ABIP80_01080, partial [Ferruginibacter sp.]